MSSWKSHLPADFPAKRLVGLGMNAVELRENDRLDEWVVKNINRDPTLPFEDGTFDGCVVTVSIQYMTRPLEVFSEVRRVLRPGAPFVVTFSNRCFPTKAVAVWRATDDEQHLRLVRTYFERSGGWEGIEEVDSVPSPGFYSDPVYAVYARKPAPAPEQPGEGVPPPA